MEPARRIELRLTPYQGVVLPLPLSRHKLAGLESNQRRHMVQSHGAPAGRATGHQSPHQVPPPASVRTRVARSLDLGAETHGGLCPRRDSNAHCPPPQGGASCRWATRTEPPSGADPDRPPYESGAAAVRGGEATGAGIGPACSCFRGRAGCQQPTRYQCGRRDSDPQAARFELARYASSLHFRISAPGELRYPDRRVKSPLLCL